MLPARTRRLRIEALCPAHAEGMHAMLADERLYRFMEDLRLPSPQALAQRYERQTAGSGDPEERWLNFILFPADAHSPIGFVQATVSVPGRMAELAYVLAPGHWGQGLAGEAVQWLIEHLRERAEVDELQVRIDARNAASLALARRLGFQPVRSIEEGGTVDHLLQRPVVQQPEHLAP